MRFTTNTYVNGDLVKTVGEVRIEAEESKARIATVYFLPPRNYDFNINAFSGMSLVIEFVNITTSTTSREFTGVVDVATYDPRTGILQLDGTDNLQNFFEVLDEAEILAVITGGMYSEAVFGPREDGWQQAMDVLSTVAKGFNLQADGATFELTDWVPKISPDRTFTQSSTVDKSLVLDIAKLRQLITRVQIKAQYRYTRLHHRERGYGWNWGVVDFCEWYFDTFPLPTRDMFFSAATGAGWILQNGNIYFETLPDTGSYTCDGSPVGWAITPEWQAQVVTLATFTLARKWTQTITETYQLTVEDADAVATFGVQLDEQSVGDETQYDDAEFDASKDGATPTDPGWAVDNLGDYYKEEDDRAVVENMLLTVLNFARVKIAGSLRRNYVQFDTPFIQGLELSETIRIDSNQTLGRVQAQGKLYQFVHTVGGGRAVTTLKVAVSRGGASADSGAIIIVPTQPNTLPAGPILDDSIVLYNHIGNDDAAPDYDEAWAGYTTNWDLTRGAPTPEQIYPIRLAVDSEAIEDASRNNIDVEALQTYTITTKEDEFLIEALGPARPQSAWEFDPDSKAVDIDVIELGKGARRAVDTNGLWAAIGTLLGQDIQIPAGDDIGWYWEVEIVTAVLGESVAIGGLRSNTDYNVVLGANSNGWGLSSNGIDNGVYREVSWGYSDYSVPFGQGDTIGIALKWDQPSGHWRVYFSVNGQWQHNANPGTNTNGDLIANWIEWRPAVAFQSSGGQMRANFGESWFKYSIPYGCQRLSDAYS